MDLDIHSIANAFVALLLVVGAGCEEENKSEPSPTVVRGLVFDAETEAAIAGASAVIIDSGTMAAAAPVAITNAAGEFSQEIVLAEGQSNLGFTVRVSAAGYRPFPEPPLRPAIPDSVDRGHTSAVVPVALIADASLQGLGSISGKVLRSGIGESGMLVVAASASDSCSTVTDTDGFYALRNVADGTWDVAALKADLTRGEASGVQVSGGAEVTGVDLLVAADPPGWVTGTCNFVAGGSPPASVVLFYPGTTEAVPGLGVETSGAFAIEGVPDGTYDVLATFDNDCNVLDPDTHLAHTAVQRITVAGGEVALDDPFNITDAIDLTGVWGGDECDRDDGTITTAEFVEGETVTFTWAAYPGSTEGYAIEVIDVMGNVVWGGFEADGLPRQRFAKEILQVDYAGDALKPGLSYRWMLWALANDKDAPYGFRYISSSENLRGLFEVHAGE